MIEGVHLLPSYVTRYAKDYSAVARYIGCKDPLRVFNGINLDDSPGNWLRNSDDAVKHQIAEFSATYSTFIEGEAEKFRLSYFERSADFGNDIESALKNIR